MLNPRKLIDRSKGLLSFGEQHVYDQLKSIGQKPKDIALFEVDSLMESAFNTEQNDEWGNYNLSVRNPQITEVSSDNINLYEANESDDVSMCHDQFEEDN